MVREEFADCRLVVHDTGRGSIASRDRMIRESSAEYFLFLDDDSHPVEKDFLAQVEAVFTRDDTIAVLTFPQRSDEFPDTLQQTDFGPSLVVASYADSGAVLRRGHYLALPGYVGEFHHAYEEPDYALQCMAAGLRVVLFTALTIRHRYTVQSRSEMRTHQFHARNEWWSVWLRCPLPQAIVVAKFRALRQLGYACKRGIRWVLREPAWWWRGVVGLPRMWAHRQPVPWPRYREWMELMRSPRPYEPN